MNTQQKFVLTLTGLLLAVIIGLFVIGMYISDYRTKHFAETVDITVEEIDKLEVSSPDEVGAYKITSEKKDFITLLDYLNQFHYKRLNGDKTSRMPMKASIIYIYIDDRIEFIVPYGPEAMISYKVYKIKDGPIED